MFHHFHGSGHEPVQGSLSETDLGRLLDGIGSGRILPAREFLERSEAGDLPDDAICLTFDDTLRSQYDVAAPVLKERGLTAFFFVYTCVLDGGVGQFELHRQFRNRFFAGAGEFNREFLGAIARGPHAARCAAALRDFDPAKYLQQYEFYSDDDRRFRFLRDDVLGAGPTADVTDALMAARGVTPQRLADGLWLRPTEVRELFDTGHLIGLHSHTHPLRMAELPPVQQEREFEMNLDRLEGLLRERQRSMSHPSNSYGPETLDILKRLGVTLGFRSDMALGLGRLEQPRQDHTGLGRRPA